MCVYFPFPLSNTSKLSATLIDNAEEAPIALSKLLLKLHLFIIILSTSLLFSLEKQVVDEKAFFAKNQSSMFFSSYRKDRFVSKTFLKGILDKYRAFGDNILNRPWGSHYMGMALDIRVLIVCAPLVYFIHYYQVERVAHKKHLDAALVKRWGPTTEDVRRKLTPEEQLIVRSWRGHEVRLGLGMPPHMRNRTEGCTLPTFHDVYGKDAVNHFGH